MLFVSSQAHAETPSGLPNISTRTDVNSGNVDIFADFLVWFASEETASIWSNIFTVGNNTSSFEAKGLEFDWDCGFRLGAGYNFVYDQWDTQLYWTWYRTDERDNVAPQPNATVIPEFESGLLPGKNATSASIRWSLLFNMIDWELGRKFWVSKNLSLRPFIGLKGGWIHQSIQLQLSGLIVQNVLTTNFGKERLKNNFWGIGPSAGVNTLWRLRDFGTHFPSFFGDFSAAMMWGTWNLSDRYHDTIGDDITTRFKKLTLGEITFRGFVGVGWDVDIGKSNCHFATRLGYEMQLWINQLRLATLQLLPLHGDLTLQGITWNFRFDF